MLSKYISLGDKIELQAVDKRDVPQGEKPRVCISKVYEILSEDTMEITMPMEQTKLILLPVDSEYDMVFYSESGLYQCFARIVDRYKSNNVYLLRVELTSNLRKYQRREYYRFSCALEMCSRNLEEEELQAVEAEDPYILQPGLPLRRSVIVDISGGGLRFISTQKYEPGSMIYCSYHLVMEGETRQYEVIGKVLAVKELENRPGTYEHRVQYHNMDDHVREEIIKFIFEEERRNRKKDRMG
jgi:c-di-GMP-binding flagellar brake protein YcgR